MFANKIKKKDRGGEKKNRCWSNCFHGDYFFLFGVRVCDSMQDEREGGEVKKKIKRSDERNARQPRLQPKAISSSKFSYAKPMGIISIW